MPVTISGSGTITGIATGGLPDGSIASGDLEDNADTAGKLASSLDLTGKTVTLPSGAGGKFASYAVIADQKTSGTDGGTFTSGDWRTRDLNTEISDADNIVSISSNQFTLGAGTYLICWTANAYMVDRHKTRLYDVTNTSSIRAGTTEYTSNSSNVNTRSFGWHRVTIAGNTTYRIEHRCQSTYSSSGFGLQVAYGEAETYTVVQIYKEA